MSKCYRYNLWCVTCTLYWFCYLSLLWQVLYILVNIDQNQKLLLVHIIELDKKAAFLYIASEGIETDVTK